MNKSDKNIAFREFVIKPGKITLNYRVSKNDDDKTIEEGNLFFELTPEIQPSNNLIAIALSTLCCQSYMEVLIDLEINQSIINKIKLFTKSKFSCRNKKINTISQFAKTNSVLSFSGGYDSLAAAYLMPERIKLVSMDFEGRFSREKDFYRQFYPCIVRTNLVKNGSTS